MQESRLGSRLVGEQVLTDSAVLNKLIQSNKKMNGLAHTTDLKNARELAIKESRDFVKATSQKVTRLLSLEHRKMAHQFKSFK